MYIIADTKLATRYDKEEALAEVAKLGPDYALYSPASDRTPEKLELLYGLTVQLLKVGKVNPLHITIEKTNLLGETEVLTARQIVNDARAWIDATDNTELADKLRTLAGKCLDPMIKDRLEEIAGSLR